MAKKVDTSFVRCPFCGKQYGLTGDYHYGSPIRSCQKCKRQYLDYTYHEIAFEGIRQVDVNPTEEQKQDKRKQGIVAVVVGLAAIAFGIVMIFFGWIAPWPFLIGGVAVAGGVGLMKESGEKGLAKTREKLEQERQASFQRVGDPNYIAALRSMGYQLPPNYY